MSEYKYDVFVQKERKQRKSNQITENEFVPMSVESSEKEIPYNDENSNSHSGGNRTLGSYMSSNKKPKSVKSTQSSLASEDSSVPPGRSGYYAPPEPSKDVKEKNDDSDSDESSVPSGKSGYYEAQKPEDKKQWKFPKLTMPKSVNMAGDVEQSSGSYESSSEKSEESVASDDTVEWISPKVVMVFGVVLLILFAGLIAVVAMAVENDLEEPSPRPTLAPPTASAPTTMPSKSPTE